MKQIYRKINQSEPAGMLLSVWGIAGFPLICQFFAEWVRIGNRHETMRWFAVHLAPLLLGTIFLALVSVGLLLLTRRIWVACLVVGMLLLLGSFVNFYKITYRNDPLLPKDLLLAVDAAKVSAELSLRPSLPMGLFLLFIVLSVLVLFPVRSPFVQKGLKAFMARALLCLVPAALCGIYLKTTLWNKELQQNFGLDTSAFYPLETYQKAGFATAFLMYCGEMKPMMPQGYDESSTLAAAAGLPLQNHAAQQRPDVIVVMLESYYRLDNVTGAVYDTDLTTNYDRYAKTGISGSYLSDKYSGGTEEMEFGALTGFSTSFLPTGSIAYMEYIRDDFPCYPRFLKENGYKTIALHPFDSTIYKRDESYPKMGFDVFYGQEDFVNPEKHGAYIDEKETVRKLIELYEQATVEGDPVFIHTVTMQNHIPNAPDEYAADYKVNATIEGVDPYYKSCLESSATGLRDIDESIGLLLDYFSACDRDVVVLLFGDHQTAIGDRKGVELLDELPEFTSLSEEQKHTATHTVPYLMWANFEQKDAETAGMMPPYQLLATTLKEYNVLRPAYFDWLASSQTTLKGINIGRVIEPDGTLGGTVKGASEAQWGVLERQKLLQYDAMFGQNWAHEAMYG